MVVSWESKCRLWFVVKVKEGKVEMLMYTATKAGEQEIKVHLKTGQWRCPCSTQPTGPARAECGARPERDTPKISKFVS